MTQKMSHRSFLAQKKAKVLPTPPPVSSATVSQLPFLQALTQEAGEGRCPGKCLHGRAHNKYFVHQLKYMGRNNL